MANEIKTKTGAQFTFADHAADFVGGAAKTSLEQAGSTDVQLDTTSLADTAGRESAQVDLGATRARVYSFIATMEFAATPTTGETVDFYWAPSPDATATDGNPMSIDGADAAAPSGIGTLAELKAACDFIGKAIITNDPTAAVQTAVIGRYSPPERYGILLVVNESAAAFHSDAVETHISMVEILQEVQ
ncbi:hypothetical protein LCGC14_2861260 [marine sediment metagenome]|uniref:Uncharacterized protein n=1 Tax=marine sediment metagenome TaxID=412755 RepID=A0A0F9ADV6_9ZZZZ